MPDTSHFCALKKAVLYLACCAAAVFSNQVPEVRVLVILTSQKQGNCGSIITLVIPEQALGSRDRRCSTPHVSLRTGS